MTPPASEQQTPQERRSRVSLVLLGGVLVLLVGWALTATAAVAVPLVFALFIAIFVYPVYKRMARALPDSLRWLGLVAVLVILLVVLLLFLGGVALSVERIINDLPSFSEQLQDWVPAMASGDDGPPDLLSMARELVGGAGGTLGGWLVDGMTTLAQRLANMMGGLIAATVIVIFLVLLMISEADLWSDKMTELSRDGDARWHRVLVTVAKTVRRFILVRTFMGVVSASAYVGWLAIFGVDLLLVWAVLTFLLTYIPNLGSVLSGLLPTLYTFLVFDPGTALLIGAGIFVIEQVIGNFLDPRLQGREVALSPVVILVSLLIWGWIWGAAGAFLATPMVIVLVTVCNSVDALRPAALFLSNQSSYRALDETLGWDRTGPADTA